MLVLASWLQEIAPFQADYSEVAERLTLAGLEVESLDPAYPWMEQAIVVRVSRVEPVMEEKNVTLCTVETGTEEAQVICGAPNVREGMLTVYVPPGTEMPDGKEIRESQVYGHISRGMLCSRREVMLEGDASGLFDVAIEFPAARVGQSLSSLAGMDDVVMEIGITPNRPDCLSITGVAREVSALFNVPLNIPRAAMEISSQAEDVTINIEDTELCRRYVGSVVTGVTIGTSPGWMARRLAASGIRPINNVVDITNYVLMELGQPLHAFDLDTLKGRGIVVRPSIEGEKIVTLDGKERRLPEGVLLICDLERPVAVAGVMGGLDTEVTEKTSSILLESAWFAPWSIRRTAKMLKLPSEASYRFERGVDFDGQLVAARRATELLVELAGGTFQGIRDENPRPYVPVKITMNPERTNSLLGTDLSAKDMAAILESIEIGTSTDSSGAIKASAPSFRPDLREEIDLVEEIARLHGFEAIPTSSPVADLIVKPVHSDKSFVDQLRSILSAQGCCEIISYSFISPQELHGLGLAENDPRMKAVVLKNPLAEDQSIMRTNLVCPMLSAIARNQKRRNMDLALFEAGAVFIDKGKGVLPEEHHRLCCGLTGRRFQQTWAWQDRESDFFDLKGLMENLFEQVGLKRAVFQVSARPEPFFVPGTCVELISEKGALIGTMGQISNKVLSAFDIQNNVFLSDISLPALIEASSAHRQFQPLARFPAVELDLSIIADDSVRVQDIFAFIEKRKPQILENIFIFDVYTGKPVPRGKKSLAFRFIYRASDRTLSEAEVISLHEPLVQELLREFKAEMRS
ncbi:MAG: phenylalanine--tRNA ligase subunit beta [Thermodesulfatator sp.]|nr:MAG: phenylalanine--tRNA ligase subunit beta [Thermodesulfatator sp.]